MDIIITDVKELCSIRLLSNKTFQSITKEKHASKQIFSPFLPGVTVTEQQINYLLPKVMAQNILVQQFKRLLNAQ